MGSASQLNQEEIRPQRCHHKQVWYPMKWFEVKAYDPIKKDDVVVKNGWFCPRCKRTVLEPVLTQEV